MTYCLGRIPMEWKDAIERFVNDYEMEASNCALKCDM